MMTKTLVTAAAVAALMAGAAQAGEKMKKTEATPTAGQVAAEEMSPDARSSASPPSVYASPGVPSETGAASATSMGADTSAVVTTNMVTNGPIADTPENRALYGQPMSNAGKRTLAKGN